MGWSGEAATFAATPELAFAAAKSTAAVARGAWPRKRALSEWSPGQWVASSGDQAGGELSLVALSVPFF